MLSTHDEKRFENKFFAMSENFEKEFLSLISYESTNLTFFTFDFVEN